MPPNPPPVRNLAELPEGELEPLARSLAHVGTLGDLLDWNAGHEPTLSIGEIVTQDEYTHDVLVRVARSLWLAFDVT